VNAYLLYPERDADPPGASPVNASALVQDLELETLFDAMSLGDPFLLDVATSVVLASLDDPGAIRYRQGVLADCLARPDVVREMYLAIVGAIEEATKSRFGLYFGLYMFPSPSTVLSGAVNLLVLLVPTLRALRRIADREAAGFGSPGFSRFFAMIQAELDDEVFRRIDDQLSYLTFRGGVPISAELGPANKGVRYVLRRTPDQVGRFGRLTGWLKPPGTSFVVNPRDEVGMRTLDDIKGEGLNAVANALAQSTDHVLGFLAAVRAELGFYVGCLNLYSRLSEKGEPTCLPTPDPLGRPMLSARGLYDVCLTLHVPGRVVGNDVDALDRSLVMVTGANQGGKSTFLRSVGLAQLMMQCGMYVAAESFRSDVRDGIFTHYKREEDATMRSGKLDEELHRMSTIIDQIRPGSLLLCNESFASTNEREGSEIARQVVRELVAAGVKVVFVTHLFDLAGSFYQQEEGPTLFLRAERESDGRRTFRVVPGEPLPTSHGWDVFERILGAAPALRDAPD
jgi:hypothetical protein